MKKLNRKIMFIFLLLAIMNAALIITIYGNYNRDEQLLQEIEMLEQKIYDLEDNIKYPDGTHGLEFM